MPALGVEPAANVAAAAVASGVPTEVAFFGRATAERLAARGVSADLTAANNVLAHVPDIRDFVAGFADPAQPRRRRHLRVPPPAQPDPRRAVRHHLPRAFLLSVADGGRGGRSPRPASARSTSRSCRPTAARCASTPAAPAPPTAHSERLAALRAEERAAGLDRLDAYRGFAPRVEAVKRDFLAFLAAARAEGKRVAAYGAAAKGNTFLNVCGVGASDIVCVFDRSPAKQGRLLPGSHIPILAPERLADVRPDYLVVLPWNLIDEIRAQTGRIADWGGRWVVALPRLEVIAP